MAIAIASNGLRNAKPYLPRNEDNPIAVAERARDEVVARLQRFCSHLGLEPMIVPSPPYAGSVWVRLEIWRRVNAEQTIAGRSTLTIKIQPKPFHRYPLEWSLEYDVCGVRRLEGPLTPLSDETLQAIVEYVAGTRPRPSLNEHKLAQTIWGRLVRPFNKVEQVRSDPLALISGSLVGAGIGFFTVGYLASGLLLFAGMLGFVYRFREPRLVLSTGRPKQEPRSPIRLDSWQTVLRGLGDAEQSFSAKVVREIEQARPSDAAYATESIWYWGVDGKEERRQIVVTFRRSIAFVQIYGYQRDLYVSWDSHVNGGTWKEEQVASGVDRTSGFRVVAHSIKKEWHVPNEYDVADASYLSEWIHAVITELVREMVAEHNLVQDIDFKILRERRRGIVGATNERVASEL